MLIDRSIATGQCNRNISNIGIQRSYGSVGLRAEFTSMDYLGKCKFYAEWVYAGSWPEDRLEEWVVPLYGAMAKIRQEDPQLDEELYKGLEAAIKTAQDCSRVAVSQVRIAEEWEASLTPEEQEDVRKCLEKEREFGDRVK
ncbi:uncharacterized protein LTR77_000922 [Saxophila tyrrhenica]|uniref:Uncharacterized protein n=1 Tax=Saxophila tyrrhenica TaxID=1690608 RepID=A0AAV9PSI3_9PEZI|nr:hypothetical protein LTR77_000922 [Saxophila tyrrhenica]